jgi:hypothetical protein
MSYDDWLVSRELVLPGGYPSRQLQTPYYAMENLMPLLAASTTGVVLLAAIYFVLLVTLGIISIRKGHWVMFIIGIFLPIFWIIGALMPPKRR